MGRGCGSCGRGSPSCIASNIFLKKVSKIFVSDHIYIESQVVTWSLAYDEVVGVVVPAEQEDAHTNSCHLLLCSLARISATGNPAMLRSSEKEQRLART